jgi:hypothetical protein
MAMIFVPSLHGRSHCPEEWTDAAACSEVATVLLEALLRLDADETFRRKRTMQPRPKRRFRLA